VVVARSTEVRKCGKKERRKRWMERKKWKGKKGKEKKGKVAVTYWCK
jgi:hypothetical protein